MHGSTALARVILRARAALLFVALAAACDRASEPPRAAPEVASSPTPSPVEPPPPEPIEPPRGHRSAGRLISLEPIDLGADPVHASLVENGRWRSGFEHLDGLTFHRLAYSSDGLRVHGFVVAPRDAHGLPSIIYLRGGNRELGALTTRTLVHRIAPLAAHGYAVVATQYRGNGGGEGREEFGGADVHDVLDLFSVLAEIPAADPTRIGLYGGSRGGTMAYQALAQTDRAIRAAVIVAGPTDQALGLREIPELEDSLWRAIVPGYDTDPERALALRSPLRWAHRLPTSTPLLILHGRRDERVSPEHALRMALALQEHHVPYRLVMLEHASHRMDDPEVVEETLAFFDRHLAPIEPPPPPPPSEPHVH